MYCGKCGKEILSGQTFCGNCGQPTDNAKQGEFEHQQISGPTMKKLQCELCSSTDLVKQEGLFVCQHCGCKYSLEDAKRMMISGTVNVSGSTIKVDNSAFVEKYLANARRALQKEDWEEVEKYYNMVEQNAPANIEALFFSSYGAAVMTLYDTNYYMREQKFNVLKNTMSVINDYFETTTENKETVLVQINNYIQKLLLIKFVHYIPYGNNTYQYLGTRNWNIKLFDSIRTAYLVELKQIYEVHPLPYVKNLIDINSKSFIKKTKQGCYVATAVYGSYDCPQVWTLRRFRDYYLSRTYCGRLFIKIYYAVSPALVKCFGESTIFKSSCKKILDLFVKKLQVIGYTGKPYKDLEW